MDQFVVQKLNLVNGNNLAAKGADTVKNLRHVGGIANLDGLHVSEYA